MFVMEKEIWFLFDLDIKVYYIIYDFKMGRGIELFVDGICVVWVVSG